MKTQKQQIKQTMKKLNTAISKSDGEKQELLFRELNEKIQKFFKFISKNAKVRVEVEDGVADVTKCPEWIKVEILDHDNY